MTHKIILIFISFFSWASTSHFIDLPYSLQPYHLSSLKNWSSYNSFPEDHPVLLLDLSEHSLKEMETEFETVLAVKDSLNKIYKTYEMENTYINRAEAILTKIFDPNAQLKLFEIEEILEKVKTEYIQNLWQFQDRDYLKANQELLLIFIDGLYGFPESWKLAQEFQSRPMKNKDMQKIQKEKLGVVEYRRDYRSVKELTVQYSQKSHDTSVDNLYSYAWYKEISPLYGPLTYCTEKLQTGPMGLH